MEIQQGGREEQDRGGPRTKGKEKFSIQYCWFECPLPPPHPQSRPAQGSGLLPGPHPSHSPQACPGLPLAPNLNFDYNMSKCLPTLNRYNMFTSNIHSMFSSFFSCLFYFSTDSFLSSKLNNFYHRHTFYNHKT